MPTVAKSIGTDARDYSTITAWEADLSNAAVYTSGDTAQGVCFADSVFNENVTISDAGSLATYIELTSASSQRHDGTAGSGVVLKPSSAGSYAIVVEENNTDITFIEINGNSSNRLGIYHNVGLSGGSVRNCLIHNFGLTSATSNVTYTTRNRSLVNYMNNFIFNNTSPANSDLIVHKTESVASNFYNNTYYYNIQGLGTSGGSGATGKIFNADANAASNFKNNIFSRIGTQVFNDLAGTSATIAYNGVESGLGSPATNETVEAAYADHFIGTSTTDPDLHLKTGTGFIDTGVDLGTSPAGVNVDIDGRDRDEAASTWDLGADEFGLNPPASVTSSDNPSRRLNLAFFGVQGLGSFSTV
jgi:hypothetical protein